jgi:membrane fusion protein (multidrug efflux system)
MIALVTPEQRTRLTPGQPAEVMAEGSDRRYPGQVSEVAEVAEADGRTFKVRIVVIDPDLPPGLRATAEITTEIDDSALTIPSAAVQNVDGDTGTVFRVVEGRAQRVEVTLGLREPRRVQIVDGLAEGDVVVTEGASSLFDQMAVDVRGEP